VASCFLRLSYWAGFGPAAHPPTRGVKSCPRNQTKYDLLLGEEVFHIQPNTNLNWLPHSELRVGRGHLLHRESVLRGVLWRQLLDREAAQRAANPVPLFLPKATAGTRISHSREIPGTRCRRS